MMKKVPAEIKESLVQDYKAVIAHNPIVPVAELNKRFFSAARKEEKYADLTDNQMRQILTFREVYRASNPRTESKKGGKKKADYVAELQELVGAELSTLSKLTISDLEVLIAAFRQATGQEQ